MFRRLRAWLHALRRQKQIDADAGDELQFHIASEIEANIRRGMSPVEARRVALRDLGGLTQTHERIRDVRSLGVGDWVRDIRYGVRALTVAPRFTSVALTTIALMVGGMTTIFALVYAVLLRPLPYPDSERLAIIEVSRPNRFADAPGPVPLSDALRLRQSTRSFESWGLYRIGFVESVPTANNEPVMVHDVRATHEVFPMLGIRVAVGRSLLPSDSQPDAPEVVVISDDLRQTLFGNNDDIVGRSLEVRGNAVTIIGVTPPGADVPRNWLSYPIMWRPVREMSPADAAMRLTTLARLRPGASIEQANAEVAVLAGRLGDGRPDIQAPTASATLLLDRIVGDFKRILWVVFGAVLCVLLIGLGNLISLQLARNGSRQREITLCAALGASRWRVVRQLGIESTLLAGLGGTIGLAAAWTAVRLIAARLPDTFPRVDQVDIDVGVVLFAIAVSLLIGLVVGVPPAWYASRIDLTKRLNEGGRSTTLSVARSRTQRTLIAVQTAIALTLLVGAGLLANSFYRLMSRDAGMQEEGLWLVGGQLPSRYDDDAVQAAFWTAALEQVRAVPGVELAALNVNSNGPLSGMDISTRVVAEGVVAAPEDGQEISYRRVSDRYFQTLGMPLLKGRPILATDTTGAEQVVVVNELAAGALWPGEDAMGKRIRLGGRDPRTVVGVIPTFRHVSLNEEPKPQAYIPYRQDAGAASSSVLLVRIAPRADGALAAVRSILTDLEKDVRVTVSTMAGVRWKRLDTERFRLALLLAFAVSAVALALVGIFGLVAYTVGQRQREIAVRVALGAARRDVLLLASRHGILPALVGLTVGVFGAAIATRVLSSFLVEIDALDAPTFTAAVVILASAGIVASVLPARHALAIDPAEALRSE